MWPFSRKPRMTAEEYADSRPKAPCGEQTEHVFWVELQGMRCPVCAAIAARERKKKERGPYGREDCGSGGSENEHAI